MNIKKVKFEGLDAYEICSKELKLIVVTQVGPRIGFFGKIQGENLLWWDKNDNPDRGAWKSRGGHRTWVSRPLADEAEETYCADNQPCNVNITDEYAEFYEGENPMKIARGFRIELLGEREMKVSSFVENNSNMLFSGGVWSVTCVKSNQNINFEAPLGDDRLGFDLIHYVIPKAWGGQTSRLDDPQFIFTKDRLCIEPEGLLSKRFLKSSQGVLKMHCKDQQVTFTKKQEGFNPDGRYPNNCNLAVYISDKHEMAELETMGEEKTIQPGTRLYNAEIWMIEEGAHI